MLNSWRKEHLTNYRHINVLGIVVEKCKKKKKERKKILYKLHKLTSEATWPFNAWNCGEDWLLSSDVKFRRNLNPNLILGSGGLATVVAGAPIVVTLGGLEVPFTGGVLILPTKSIKKIRSNKQIALGASVVIMTHTVATFCVVVILTKNYCIFIECRICITRW